MASQTSVSTSATSSQTTEGTWDTTNPPTAAEAATQNSESTVVEAETSNPQEINLSDSDSTGITAGGAYKLVGETTGSATVTAPDSTVTLILDGASIGGGITVNDGDVALVSQGMNTIAGQVYAASDLTLGGDGSLTVEAPEDGIVAKDDVTISSGTLTVKAGDGALRGTDSVTISGGDLTLEAGGDAVASTKDDDEQKGWIRVTGGTVGG